MTAPFSMASSFGFHPPSGPRRRRRGDSATRERETRIPRVHSDVPTGHAGDEFMSPARGGRTSRSRQSGGERSSCRISRPPPPRLSGWSLQVMISAILIAWLGPRRPIQNTARGLEWHQYDNVPRETPSVLPELRCSQDRETETLRFVRRRSSGNPCLSSLRCGSTKAGAVLWHLWRRPGAIRRAGTPGTCPRDAPSPT